MGLHDQSIQIDDVLAKLAAHTKAEDVAVQDLVVNPRTGTAYLAVHADQKPLIVKVTAKAISRFLICSNVLLHRPF